MDTHQHLSAKMIVILVVLGLLLIVGIWYFSSREDSLPEPESDTEVPLSGYTAPTVNPYETMPDVNPVEKTNPFKDLKTNPFE